MILVLRLHLMSSSQTTNEIVPRAHQRANRIICCFVFGGHCKRYRTTGSLGKVRVRASLKPGFHSNARNARMRLHCVCCVNENRKQRKCLIGCFDDWLLRSTIPIRWCLRSLREKSYAMFFAFVIFLRLLRFLRTFYFACIFFSYARPCVRCVHLNGNQALVLNFLYLSIRVRTAPPVSVRASVSLLYRLYACCRLWPCGPVAKYLMQ